jgi:hypothetical protein
LIGLTPLGNVNNVPIGSDIIVPSFAIEAEKMFGRSESLYVARSAVRGVQNRPFAGLAGNKPKFRHGREDITDVKVATVAASQVG